MPYHLILFFTYGTSLKMWNDIGMFHREVALYKKLQNMGIKISFITYGMDDRQYQSQLTDISIFDNHFRLPNNVYARLIPFLHMNVLRNADIYKTNQFKGGEFAVLAARFWQKPVIARAGYSWKGFVSKQDDADDAMIQKVANSQTRLIDSASMIIVTTQRHADQIQVTHSNKPIRIHPNYILTDIFKPSQTE